MTRTPPPILKAERLTVNPEAERAYLACLMRDPDMRLIVENQITADHFATTNAREAFEAISGFIADGTPPDPATLKGAVSGATMIELETSLTENASAANSHVYAKLLKEAKAARDEQAARDWLMQAVQKGRPPHELRAIVEGIEQAALCDASKSRFFEVNDLCELPASENWLIKGYLPMDGLSVAFGDPGCGKSFLAIDMACHVATGRPWRGQDVKQGTVLYIAGEGKNGLSKRFKAWFERHGETPRNIRVCTVPIQLVDAGGIAALVAEIRAMPEAPALIVIDTLNRNFGPGDENGTADMTRAVAGLDALRTATGAAILALHHTGHGDKTRGRGSIVLNASVDMEYRITKTDRTVQAVNTKSKDSDTPPPLAWILEKQVLPWADSDGQPMDSAVLASTEASTNASTRGLLTRPQRLTLKALDTAIERHGDDGAALIADWRRAALEAGITQSESRQGKHAAFQRAVDVLVDAGLVIQDGHRCYPATASTRQQTSTRRQHVDNVDAGNMAVNSVNTSTHPLRGVDDVDVDAKPTTDDLAAELATLAGLDVGRMLRGELRTDEEWGEFSDGLAKLNERHPDKAEEIAALVERVGCASDMGAPACRRFAGRRAESCGRPAPTRNRTAATT